MQIAHRLIGANHPPFIIAEMSGNHNQSYERAMAIVEAAAEAGAHGMKFQTYTPDTMTLDLHEGEFLVSDRQSPWYGHSMYDIYRKAYTPWEWHKPLFEYCRKLGLVPFSSAFDLTAVDFLEELEVPCHKIASPEIVDLSLVRAMAATGKPLIISVGMATVAEIGEAVDTARRSGCTDLILLKCTSSYPANPAYSNILTIPHMRSLFDCEVGLSDHTMGVGVSVAAVAHGASVIEKHFTLSREDGGVDSIFSLQPDELRFLVDETERAWQGMGKVFYGPTEVEVSSVSRRRSLYVSRNIKEGELLGNNNVSCIRPGLGLAPKYFKIISGKKINRNAKCGEPLSWEMIE